MTEEKIRSLLTRFEETCESGKPVLEEFRENWKQHEGFLQMIRFLLSAVEDMPQKPLYLTQIDQMRRDVDALFALCGAYHGLGTALKGFLKDYQADVEKQECQ